VIEFGMDVDGDTAPDLDSSRIYFFGHSLGGMWGTILLAIEPDVRAGVLNSVGTPYDNLRLSPTFRAGSIGVPLASRIPSLINSPGLTQVGGVNVGPPFFNENLPLRDQPQLTNTIAGAMEIQEVLDRMKWVTQSASSLACAPYLRKSPLPGVPPKSVLFQFNIGDRIATNPTTSALLRAGDLVDRTTRALRRGYEAAQADPAGSVDDLVKASPGLDPSLTTAELDAVRPAFGDPPGGLDPARLRAWAAWDVRFGILKLAPDVTQAFVLS